MKLGIITDFPGEVKGQDNDFPGKVSGNVRTQSEYEAGVVSSTLSFDVSANWCDLL